MGKKLDKSRNFFRQLKRSDPEPVYFVWGEETFMLDEAVDAIIDHVAPEGVNDFNFDAFRGRDATGDAVVSACEMLPMMADRRLVVVRDAQELADAELDGLAPYLDDPAETTCLVVHAQTAKKSLDGRRRVVKRLKKAGMSCEFASLYENEVGPILQKHAAKRDLRLPASVTAYLIESVGTDLNALDKALDKLDLYIGPAEQTPRLVQDDQAQAVVSDTKVRSVFDLTDAVGDRKFEDALHILANMLVNGESPIGTVAMLARHFRIVAKLHDPSVRNKTRNQKAGIVHVPPFFVKDYQRHARTFGAAEIETIRARLLEVDLALKSSNLDDKTVMERLLYDICFRDADTGADHRRQTTGRRSS